jgi:NTE family protein
MIQHEYGIVLGGGGTRGFAHLGVLKALEEKGIKPGILSGASAGSIAGALIADGKSPDEAFRLFKDKGFMSYTSVKFPRRGFFSLEGLGKRLVDILSVKNLEDLQIPFYVAVSNLNSGHAEYLNSGPIARAVMASSAIPVMFTPVEMDGNYYADGGLVDNLPSEPLRDKCDKLIISSLIPVNKDREISSLKSIISRVAEMATNGNLINEKSDADLIIEPPDLANYDYMSVRKADEIFNLGYNYTLNLDIKF